MSDGDILIPVLTVLIAAFGVLMVYSASSYTAEATYGDAFFFAKKQLLGFVLGTVGMIAVSFFPYTKLQKLKWAALGVSVVLLAVLFIPGVGKENYGATRWINLGPLTIQPSEIAKYGFVIFAASYMSEKPERMKTFVGMLPVLGAGGGICLLGEVLRGWYLTMGLDKELAGTLTSCTLVVLSALLTTLGLYQKLAAKAGAGTLVPITGFANAVVSAAIEFKTEGRVLGTGAKMFLIAGPVIVYGTLAAVLYGSVCWLFG